MKIDRCSAVVLPVLLIQGAALAGTVPVTPARAVPAAAPAAAVAWPGRAGAAMIGGPAGQVPGAAASVGGTAQKRKH